MELNLISFGVFRFWGSTGHRSVPTIYLAGYSACGAVRSPFHSIRATCTDPTDDRSASMIDRALIVSFK